MRLINVTTFQLEEFPNKDVPQYAILSHTWGHDSEELSFSDVQFGHIDGPGVGAVKFRGCCQQAQREGLGYAWIDTCCIDKTNQNELNESINSMFRWYSRASICYAYLSDVPDQPEEEPRRQGSSFWESRWFRRGWTLQELLAPKTLHFYNKQWAFMGTKGNLGAAIERITGVRRPFLLGPTSVRTASVAQRMAWAAHRETKREEDLAYCLLGVFGVTMPLIYGEGGRQAFLRLQEQIMKTTPDDSILAWGSIAGMAEVTDAPGGDEPLQAVGGRILATQPSDFSHSRGIVRKEHPTGTLRSLEMTGGHLRIHLSLLKTSEGGTIGLLNCRPENDTEHVIGIPLAQMASGSSDEYVRLMGSHLTLQPAELISDSLLRLIYIKNGDGSILKDEDKEQHFWLYDEAEFETIGLQITQVEPPSCWEQGEARITYRSDDSDGDAVPLLVRLRHSTKNATQDFVLALDLDRNVSPSVCRFFIVVCSRETSLQTLWTNIQHIKSKAAGCTSASNGSLNLLIKLERNIRGQVFTIRPQKSIQSPHVTIDASKEVACLNFAVSLIQAFEKKKGYEAECQGIEHKSRNLHDSTQLVRIGIQDMEAERERIGEHLRALVAQDNRLHAESIDLSSRHQEIEKAQEILEKDWLATLAAWEPRGDDKSDRMREIFQLRPAQGQTPLHWAAGNGRADVVEILLDQGADVTAVDEVGQTPLMAAASGGHVDAVRVLLGAGKAYVNMVDHSGRTALGLATEGEHVEVVRALLAISDSDIAIENSNDLTAFNWTEKEKQAAIRLLMSETRDEEMRPEPRHPSIVVETSENAISQQGEATVEHDAGNKCTLQSEPEMRNDIAFDSNKSEVDMTAATDGASDSCEIVRVVKRRRSIFGDSGSSFIMKGDQNDQIELVVASRDPIMVASATAETIKLWDIASRKCLRRIEVSPRHCISGLAISHDAKLIAAIYAGDRIVIWDATTGQVSKRLLGDDDDLMSPIEFSHDSSLLASASLDCTVKLWSVSAFRKRETSSHQTLQGHESGINSVAFSPDSRLVVSGSNDKTIRIWSVSKAKCLRILEGHTNAVTSIAVSYDSMLVASASNDKTVRLWRMATGMELKRIDQRHAVVSVTFSQDSTKLLSTAVDRMVTQWDMKTGRIASIVSVETILGAVALSRHSTFFVYGCENEFVQVTSFPHDRFHYSRVPSAVLVSPVSRSLSRAPARQGKRGADGTREKRDGAFEPGDWRDDGLPLDSGVDLRLRKGNKRTKRSRVE